MINKKTIGLFVLCLYLLGIGLALIATFVQLDELNLYILRGISGREKSLVEDVIDSLKGYQGNMQGVREQEIYKLSQTLMPLDRRALIKIPNLLICEEIILVLSAAFYILSGIFLFLRSKKCQMFFRLGVLSWGISCAIFWFFNSSQFQFIEQSIRAVEQFIYASCPARIPPGFDFGKIGLLAFFTIFLYSFLFAVVIPSFLFSRRFITEQLHK